MARPWEVDAEASFTHRLGKTAAELGFSKSTDDCPEIWRLDNGDVAIVGRDVTERFADRIPNELRIGHDERLVVIPGNLLASAKNDI